jgi:hypothetical protein
MTALSAIATVLRLKKTLGEWLEEAIDEKIEREERVKAVK